MEDKGLDFLGRNWKEMVALYQNGKQVWNRENLLKDYWSLGSGARKPIDFLRPTRQELVGRVVYHFGVSKESKGSYSRETKEGIYNLQQTRYSTC